MKGDFSRNTFDPRKHFTRVLMQQGRVQLDANWNEQVSILSHYLRTLAADLIGPHGGPTHDLGFAISSNGPGDFDIGDGFYYVDGILCENRRAGTATVTYNTQPHYPSPGGLNANANDYLVYLDVWERHITYIEDEDESGDNPSIREVALGTADTASRAKVVWQVKVLPADELESIQFNIRLAELRSLAQTLQMRLKALAPPVTASSIPDDVNSGIENIKGMKSEVVDGIVISKPGQPDMVKFEEDLTRLGNSIDQLAINGNLTLNRHYALMLNLDSIKAEIARLEAMIESEGTTIKAWLSEQLTSNARLRARALQDPEQTDDLCTIPPESRYRGPENQLYRVEIHQGGQVGEATFKWSRENGSVIFPIESIVTEFGMAVQGEETVTDTALVTLRHSWRDDRFSLQVGNWVEILDDDYINRGLAEALWQVDKPVDRDKQLVSLKRTRLATEDNSDVGQSPSKHPYVRRWDHPGGDLTKGGPELGDGGAVLIKELTCTEQNWLLLEDGIQVQFQQLDPPSEYHTGDYWLIPARTATGDVEWPGPASDPAALKPHGVVHHYAPLAIISFDDDPVGVTECRYAFTPAAEPV